MNRNKVLIIVIIILISVLAIMSVYILYNNSNNNETIINNNTSSVNNTSTNDNILKQTQEQNTPSTPPGKKIWSGQLGDWIYEEDLGDGMVRQYDAEGNLIGSTIPGDKVKDTHGPHD